MAAVTAKERLLAEMIPPPNSTSSLPKTPHAVLVGYPDFVQKCSVRIAVLRHTQHQHQQTTTGSLLLPTGKVGEIVASGPHVHTVHPHRLVKGDDGKIYLRTGDAGFMDEFGRIWLVGRTEWAYKDQKVGVESDVGSDVQSDVDVSVRVETRHYWSTAAERLVLERFGDVVTYAVYLEHEGIAKLFIEAPNGCS
ncbi:hypothetical protein HK102_012662, partial [Quaeritorhiza haematococci]